jgi:hypothetical protein
VEGKDKNTEKGEDRHYELIKAPVFGKKTEKTKYTYTHTHTHTQSF